MVEVVHNFPQIFVYKIKFCPRFHVNYLPIFEPSIRSQNSCENK